MSKELPSIGQVIKRAAHVIWTLDLGRPGTETLTIPAQGPEKTLFAKTWSEPFRGFVESHVIGWRLRLDAAEHIMLPALVCARMLSSAGRRKHHHPLVVGMEELNFI